MVKAKSAKTTIKRGRGAKKVAPVNRRAKRPSRPKAKPLPAAIPLQDERAESPKQEPEKKGVLFGLFGEKKETAANDQQANQQGKEMVDPSGGRRPIGSKKDLIDPTPIDAKFLSGIPETIGDNAEGKSEEGMQEGKDSNDAAMLQSAMAIVAFNPKHGSVVMRIVFNRIAASLGDKWKLKDSEAQELGEPTAALLNDLWRKLMELLPVWLSSKANALPSLAPFIVAVGFTVMTKAMQPEKEKPEEAPAKAERKPPASEGGFAVAEFSEQAAEGSSAVKWPKRQ